MKAKKIKLPKSMQKLTITIRDAGDMSDTEADQVVKYLRGVANKFKKERGMYSKRLTLRFFV